MAKSFIVVILCAYFLEFNLSFRFCFLKKPIFIKQINRCETNSDTNNISVDFTDELLSNDASYLSIIAPTIDTVTTSDNITNTHTTDNEHDNYINGNGNGLMTADDLSVSQFGSIFMQCAPYIAQHRGTTIVIHIPCKLLKHNREIFDSIMDDIAILHLLGIQLVLVAGVKDNLDSRILHDTNMTLIYHDGMRITDDLTLTLLKELCKYPLLLNL